MEDGTSNLAKQVHCYEGQTCNMQRADLKAEAVMREAETWRKGPPLECAKLLEGKDWALSELVRKVSRWRAFWASSLASKLPMLRLRLRSL